MAKYSMTLWRVISGKLWFGSGIRIGNPDHHQAGSLGSWLPSHNILFKSVHNFLSNPANRQTNKPRNKQGWIHNIRPTPLANVNIKYKFVQLAWLGNFYLFKYDKYLCWKCHSLKALILFNLILYNYILKRFNSHVRYLGISSVL